MIPIITLAYVARLLFIALLFTDFGRSNKVSNTKLVNSFATVELFTSKGCSSCPAADEAIIELSKEFPGNVYFLSYDVKIIGLVQYKTSLKINAAAEAINK